MHGKLLLMTKEYLYIMAYLLMDIEKRKDEKYT